MKSRLCRKRKIEDAMKRCPYCKKIIRRKATVCPHCGRKIEYFWRPLGKKEYFDWSLICGLNQYCFYEGDKKEIIKQYLPSDLRHDYFNKLEGIMAMCSGSTESSSTYFVLNLYRRDKGSVIDEDPLLATFISGQKSTPSGLIIPHGKWPGRTSPIPIPESVIDEIENSGLRKYYPSSATFLNIPPSGPLSNLKGFSDSYAFDRVIKVFQAKRGQ